MKRSDLEEDIKEKLLLEGSSGYGKSHISLIITMLYAKNNKKVLYIDPEGGTDKEKKKIFSDLSDDELDNIDLVKVFDVQPYLKYMLGWTEETQVGSQKIEKKYGIDYDLKVCDGLTTEIDLYKTKLTQRFIKQGYYEIGGTPFTINNPDTFVLPYQFYGKLYDQIKDAINIMLGHRYDIVCTMHSLKDTESQRALEQSIYQKFDSVIKLNKITLPVGTPKWSAHIIKNRGRESPNRPNTLDSTDPLLRYFIKKFGMNEEEIMKKLILD